MTTSVYLGSTMSEVTAIFCHVSPDLLLMFNGQHQTSKCPIKLMTRTQMLLETSVYSLLNHLTQMVGQEYFIEFSRSESFKLSTKQRIFTCLWAGACEVTMQITDSLNIPLEIRLLDWNLHCTYLHLIFIVRICTSSSLYLSSPHLHCTHLHHIFTVPICTS
jgi:hypothetical protein